MEPVICYVIVILVSLPTLNNPLAVGAWPNPALVQPLPGHKSPAQVYQRPCLSFHLTICVKYVPFCHLGT